MKKFVFSFLLLILFPCAFAWSQDSLIETLINLRDAFVSVQAIKILTKENDDPTLMKNETGQFIIASKTKTYITNGAGVILDNNGIIVTNLHILQGANQIFIYFSDKQKRPAQILALYPNEDIAFLKIDAPFPLKSINIADSNNVQFKEEVINIGHSYLNKGTLSMGRITGLATQKTSGSSDISMIETNIALNKGDSGGPLLNRQGELVGMITAQINKTRVVFAIPSNKIKKLYSDLKK